MGVSILLRLCFLISLICVSLFLVYCFLRVFFELPCVMLRLADPTLNITIILKTILNTHILIMHNQTTARSTDV